MTHRQTSAEDRQPYAGELASAHTFVVPRLNGPITGGTRFNRSLIDALLAQGKLVDWFPIHDIVERGHNSHARTSSGLVWVDEHRIVVRAQAMRRLQSLT